MTQCSQSVPPALCRLLCPLPSPVIISVWLLLSFLCVAFLSRTPRPLLPSPGQLQCSAVEVANSSEQVTPGDAHAGLKRVTAAGAALA